MPKSFRYKQKPTNNAIEKIMTLLERDLALAVVMTLLGLINSDFSGSGWPVHWLRPGGHVDFAVLITSYVVTFFLVLFADLMTAVIRRASEPDADKLYVRNASVTANSAEDVRSSVITSDIDSVTVSGAKGKKRTFGNPAPAFKPQTISGRTETKPVKKKSATGVLAIAIFFIAISIITSVFDFINDSSDTDDYYSDDYEWDSDSEFQESGDAIDWDRQEQLEAICNKVIDGLYDSDTGLVEQIGEGDAQAIADICPWDPVHDIFHDHTYYIQPDHVILKYWYFDNDTAESYDIAFLLEGENIAEMDADAKIVGMAICNEDVPDEPAFIGQAEINGISILE